MRILSRESAKRMAEATAAFVVPTGWRVGLGWMILPGGVLSHGGGGPGVNSVLFAHRASGRVLAMLRNCDQGGALDPIITDPIVNSWTGIRTPAPPRRQSGPIDPKLYEGVYENVPLRVEVIARDKGLALRFSATSKYYDNLRSADEAPALPLDPIGDHAFEVEGVSPQLPKSEVRFVPGPGGRMRFCAPAPAMLFGRVN